MSSAFSDIFGGDTLYPADLSYRAITLTASTTLQWPTEASAQTNLVAAIMDVTASAGPLVITMPPATEVSTGTAVIFNNVGASTFVVNDNGGAQIVSVASGEIWTAYVTSNATAAGTWETYQNGAGTSSASAAALAGYGLKAITTTLNQTMPVTLVSMDFTADATYRAGVWVWTGGAGVASLTSPVTLGNDWFTNIKNSGSGSLVLTPLAGTIDGESTVTLGPDESAIVVSDGTNFYTIGLTPIPTPGFDYAAIAVPGTGDYTLTGTELARISYSFTGVLTGDRNIIVPASLQQYWVVNNTTGAFTFTVKTPAGTGVIVPTGLSLLLFCDGTNVVDATTGRVLNAAPTSSGTDTVTATFTPYPTRLTPGARATFVAGGTNTGATTFNPNALGAGAVQKRGTALAAGDITSGNAVDLVYDGTQWQMISPTVALNRAQTWSALQTFSSGISFGGTTLSNYTEGTWTPTLEGESGGGTQSYQVQVGRYIRVGNLVTVWCNILLTAKDGATAGNLIVNGLPFTSSNVADLLPAISVGYTTNLDLNVASAYYAVGGLVLVNTNYLRLYELGDNNTATPLTVADFGNTSGITFTAQYRTG